MTTKIELKLYTGSKAINSAIEANGIVGAGWQAETHRIACSILAAVGRSKDVRVIDKFLKSLPESARLNSLRKWFSEFGPVSFGEANAIAFDANKATQLGEAMAKPYWSFKAMEGEYVPIDMSKWAEQAIGKLVKDQAKTGRDHSALIMALKVAPADGAVH